VKTFGAMHASVQEVWVDHVMMSMSRGKRIVVWLMFCTIMLLSMTGALIDPEISAASDGCESCGSIERYESVDMPSSLPLIYFYSPRCSACRSIEQYLDNLEEQYAERISVLRYNILTDEGRDLRTLLNMNCGVPDALANAVPAVFFNGALIGEEDIRQNLELHITQLHSMAQSESLPASANEDVYNDAAKSRFAQLSGVPILIAGLLDGVNPCSFMTLALLIATLALLRNRSLILITGMVFALAAFLANFLIGAGLLKMSTIPLFDSISASLYVIAGLLCLVVSVVNFVEFWRLTKDRHGVADAVTHLPRNMRNLIKKIIRFQVSLVSSKAYLLVGLVTGFVVALLEFPCTGQIYLPTISFMVGNPLYRDRAIVYLAMYNLAYVAPLVLLVLLGAWFSNVRGVAKAFTENMRYVKLTTAVFFMALGMYVIFS
jgi:thiol-disulfide isomerase/thioredoxin